MDVVTALPVVTVLQGKIHLQPYLRTTLNSGARFSVVPR